VDGAWSQAYPRPCSAEQLAPYVRNAHAAICSGYPPEPAHVTVSPPSNTVQTRCFLICSPGISQVAGGVAGQCNSAPVVLPACRPVKQAAQKAAGLHACPAHSSAPTRGRFPVAVQAYALIERSGIVMRMSRSVCCPALLLSLLACAGTMQKSCLSQCPAQPSLFTASLHGKVPERLSGLGRRQKGVTMSLTDKARSLLPDWQPSRHDSVVALVRCRAIPAGRGSSVG